MINCIICYSEFQSLDFMKCSCQYCEDCLFEWVEQSSYSQKFKQYLKIECPNEQCQQDYDIEAIKQIFQHNQQNYQKIEAMALKNYLQSCSDIRSCPRENCNFWGIVPKIKCSNEFQCEMCGYTWIDLDYLCIHTSLLLHLSIFLQQSLNFLFYFLLTKQCPHCGISIMKDGGCSHMRCKQCDYYFCWTCFRPVNEHDDKKCYKNWLGYYSILTYMAIHYLAIFGLISPVTQVILMTFEWNIKIILSTLVVVLPAISIVLFITFFILVLLQYAFADKWYINEIQQCLQLTLLGALMSFICFQVTFNLLNISLNFVGLVILVEIMVVGLQCIVFVVIIFLKQHFYDIWVKYVV